MLSARIRVVCCITIITGQIHNSVWPSASKLTPASNVISLLSSLSPLSSRHMQRTHINILCYDSWCVSAPVSPASACLLHILKCAATGLSYNIIHAMRDDTAVVVEMRESKIGSNQYFQEESMHARRKLF